MSGSGNSQGYDTIKEIQLDEQAVIEIGLGT